MKLELYDTAYDSDSGWGVLGFSIRSFEVWGFGLLVWLDSAALGIGASWLVCELG